MSLMNLLLMGLGDSRGAGGSVLNRIDRCKFVLIIIIAKNVAGRIIHDDTKERRENGGKSTLGGELVNAVVNIHHGRGSK